MIFITGRSKRAIEEHFDKAYELESELERKNKHALPEVVRSVLPSPVNCICIRQAEPLGLGHAVLCAKPVVGVYQRERASVLAVQEVPKAETKQYGIVSAQPWSKQLERVVGIVEKPAPEVAPSNLAVVGRYVLTPTIFSQLENIKPGAGGELQLTDGIEALLSHQLTFAYRFEGKRYDCGSKLGYLRATVELDLKHHEVGTEFGGYLVREFALPKTVAADVRRVA